MTFWIGIGAVGVMLFVFILMLININGTIKDYLNRQSGTEKYDDSCIDFEKTINNWAKRCEKNHQGIEMAIRDLYDNIRSLQQQVREMKQKINDMCIEEE
jgi:peptidoglycan hydrolase CwlO-like protein